MAHLASTRPPCLRLSFRLIQLRTSAFTVVRAADFPGSENDPERRRTLANMALTCTNRLGKRVGGNPSRVRISYPPPVLSPGTMSKGPTVRGGALRR
jgi:hypothetical protein